MTGAAVIVAALGTASAQENDDRRKCVEAVDPDLAVGQCTRALQSRELSRPNLATAFSHRGDAYQTQGAYDLAIRDYDRA